MTAARPSDAVCNFAFLLSFMFRATKATNRPAAAGSVFFYFLLFCSDIQFSRTIPPPPASLLAIIYHTVCPNFNLSILLRTHERISSLLKSFDRG